MSAAAASGDLDEDFDAEVSTSGSEERVIHEEVPAWVAEAVGGACEVRMLDGQGHRGCPADATRNFLTEAAGEAAGWLAKS